MNQSTTLRIPESLQRQLDAYRRRVRRIKMTEAMAIAGAVWLTAFLGVAAMDRLGDTPAMLRGGLLVATLGATAIIPLFLYRWVWRQSSPEELARLLRRKLPGVGDQLLGVIELSKNATEQSRSPALCQAAMGQVATDAEGRDFLHAVPRSRHRLWSGAALAMGSIAAVAAFAYPAAAANAWARFTAPWSETPRYTFTVLDTLPEPWIVPHGEPATVSISLDETSRWRPPVGELSIGSQRPVTASLQSGHYRFAIPPQIAPQWMTIHIGDATHRVRVEPTLRPSLVEILPDVTLPPYLGGPPPLQKDARSGVISLVKGSRGSFTATANRKLASGSIHRTTPTGGVVHRESPAPRGATFHSGISEFDSSQTLQFHWQDHFGLSASEPFTLSVAAIDDEPPTLVCEGLPRQAVVLESEVLKFTLRAHDDFGVRRVGLMWRGLPEATRADATEGERLLDAGDSHAETLEAKGTFSAASLNIQPQPIELFVWVEDYLPNRPRVFSPPHRLYVLTPDQHLIWVTEQLSKWHRQTLEVRDRELQLYATNQELRSLSPDELNRAETRRQIERQADAERSNGRRLDGMNVLGQELLRSAARNPEIGVGHLDRWAEMLQILDDVSTNRMPSVADLLEKAATSNPSLEPAVDEQEDLLAEFERVADEMNTILANLEGSTLVKRLKAVSRAQSEMAGRIGEHLEGSFGVPDSRVDKPAKKVFAALSAAEEENSQKISRIMDDLAAYFQRRQFVQFETVLEEMRGSDVIGGLRQLAAEIPQDQGLSLAQCEYWSDTLDRWAEELIDPACSGKCPGGKSPDSLPPSIVLEALQILEAEVNLREQTRVAEQAQSAQPPEQYAGEAIRLAKAQAVLDERIVAVAQQIQALPDSDKHFPQELALLARVDVVMQEAAEILERPETGPPAIAAETEVIELLLQSKRINPKAGGGDGSAPGGGGSGTTTDSALALLGSGLRDTKVRQPRHVPQTTGDTGSALPEEFRVGLDEYFNRLEPELK